ncbi:MAG: hypothetical protein ACODAJ_16765, partial [Planctomycetota bacterium]
TPRSGVGAIQTFPAIGSQQLQWRRGGAARCATSLPGDHYTGTGLSQMPTEAPVAWTARA